LATGAGTELSWQDEPLCLIDQERAVDTSSTLLVPGYKFNFFSRNAFRAIVTKREKYPGIKITKDIIYFKHFENILILSGREA
jgi:hypothetical protein